MSKNNTVIWVGMLITFSAIVSLLMSQSESRERDKWQDACDKLDIEIRWHKMALDGVTTNWVEMIDLRNNEIRKAR